MTQDSSPIKKLAHGLVQLSLANQFIGFGFLINQHQIITCDHVLKAAKAPGPRGYKITFPLDNEAKSCRASLAENGSFADKSVDIAILEVHNSSAYELQPAPIIFVQPEALWHHKFMAFGFPASSEIMDYVDGIIFGPNDRQWVQLEDKENIGRFIERGFSGTAIWDEDLQAIVGMLVALDGRYPRVAFMTPITTIAQTYPRIIGDVYNNLKSTWRVSLEDHYGFRESFVRSPLDRAWSILSRQPSWRQRVSGAMKRIRSAASEFAGLREVGQSAAQVLKTIGSNAMYEVIYNEIKGLSALLDSPRIAKNINQQIARLENLTDTNWSELRYRDVDELTPDEQRLLQMVSLRQYQGELRNISESPDFDKCLLIMGGMGSGKTHFIHEILENSLTEGERKDDLVVLPLTRTVKAATVAEILLENLNNASGLRWPGLEYFDSFLRAYDRYMDWLAQAPDAGLLPAYDFSEEDKNLLGEQESAGDDLDEDTLAGDIPEDLHLLRSPRFEPRPHDTRWVIAIDDLSLWADEMKSFVDEWIDLVVNSTHLHSLCWVANIPNSYYVQLAQYASRHKNFWVRYGVLTYRDILRSNIRGYQAASPNIEHWLALDALNVQQEVGLRLVRDGLAQKWEQVNLAIQHNESARNNLSNPLVACTWLDMVKQEEFPNLVNAVNLNFIEFIQYFWKQQFSILLSHPLNQSYEQPFSEKELRYFVILLARHITQAQGQSMDLSRLVSSICALSNGKLGFNDRTRVKAALDLMKLGLVLGEKTEEESLQEPQEDLELRFNPFWGYFLAQEIMERGKNTPASPAQMELLFKNIQGDIISDTLEYFLMLANNQYSDEASLPFFENTLASPKLPGSSVWMASAKSNEVIKKAMSLRAQRAAGRVFDAQALFAYLYFLCEIPLQVMDLQDRFAVFHKLFSQIGRNKFSNYFLYITEWLFEKLESPDELLCVMPCLSNSEVMGISRSLAELTADRLFRLVKKQAQENREYVHEYDPVRIINFLLEYLGSIHDEYYSKNDFDSYRENVLYYVFFNLAYDQGTGLYDLLRDADWYENPLFRQNQQMQLHMERQANRALGMLYHSSYEEDLWSLLEELCESDDSLDRVNAVHIIRHTEVIGKDNRDVRVAKEFKPMLEKLFLDKSSRMKRLVNWDLYKKFFRDNLDDYETLERQRGS